MSKFETSPEFQYHLQYQSVLNFRHGWREKRLFLSSKSFFETYIMKLDMALFLQNSSE
jgi:hypothetical protein